MASSRSLSYALLPSTKYTTCGSSSTTLTSLISSWNRIQQESEMGVRHADDYNTYLVPYTPTGFLVPAMQVFCLLPSMDIPPKVPSFIISPTSGHYHIFQFCSECEPYSNGEALVILMMRSRPLTTMTMSSPLSLILASFSSFKQLLSYYLSLCLSLIHHLSILLLLPSLQRLLFILLIMSGSKHNFQYFKTNYRNYIDTKYIHSAHNQNNCRNIAILTIAYFNSLACTFKVCDTNRNLMFSYA